MADLGSEGLSAFEALLRGRVEEYWEDWDDSGWAEEATIWRRQGFNPDLLLPRPQLQDPSPGASRWRFSVAFADQTVDYWRTDSTALFFAGVTWGSLTYAEIMPSMGGAEQYRSGLMGGFMVSLKDAKGDPIPFVSLGINTPVWDDLAREALASGCRADLTPHSYWDSYLSPGRAAKGFPGYDDGRQAKLGALLPVDVRSPFLMDLGSIISYSVGWFALVYGLRALVDGYGEVNRILATTPLRGFAPA